MKIVSQFLGDDIIEINLSTRRATLIRRLYDLGGGGGGGATEEAARRLKCVLRRLESMGPLLKYTFYYFRVD